MKHVFLAFALFLNVAFLASCDHYHIPKGNPGEAPNTVTCIPGHELSDHCHGK